MTITDAPQRARDAGIARALNANPTDAQVVRDAILRWVRENPQATHITANDVRPLLPEGIRTPVIGGVFATFVAKKCRPAGGTTSTDIGTHSKRIGRYRITRGMRELAGA